MHDIVGGGSEQAAHAEHGAVACTRHKSTHIYTTQELCVRLVRAGTLHTAYIYACHTCTMVQYTMYSAGHVKMA